MTVMISKKGQIIVVQVEYVERGRTIRSSLKIKRRVYYPSVTSKNHVIELFNRRFVVVRNPSVPGTWMIEDFVFTAGCEVADLRRTAKRLQEQSVGQIR